MKGFAHRSQKFAATLLHFFFFCFPLSLIICLSFPGAVIFKVISFRIFCFFWPQELINVVFLSFSWSSNRPVCFDLVVKTRIPFDNLPCPSFFREGRNSHCHPPLHSSACFNPARYFHLFRMFNGFFCASYDEFYPFFFLFILGKRHRWLSLCSSFVRSLLLFPSSVLQSG